MSTAAQEGVRGATASPERDITSKQAKAMFSDLMSLDKTIRRDLYRGLTGRDMEAVLRVAFAETGTAYGLWVDDPVGFVEDVVGETTWSKQREVLESVPNHMYTAVPSAFGTGKTHISARAALWRSLVFPFGTSLTVTTATNFRQVKRQLWPHVRSCVSKANLPLDVDQTQMHAYDKRGLRVPVAYGFSAPSNDEAAVQGIHAPRLFIVVDEAGGIARVIGSAMRGLMTGSDTRLLAIGNPPTDDEGSWFEGLCTMGQERDRENPKDDDEDVNTITISAYDAPMQSKERTKRCRACPEEVPPHGLETHLVSGQWIKGAIRDHGEDAPFVIAKVHARFPKGGPARTIPADWVDRAVQAPEPVGMQYHRLLDLGLPDERAEHVVRDNAWIRLGVDVAADGGDEFVISRAIGDLGTIEHSSAGAGNANSVDVAGKVLKEIRRANALRKVLGTQARVRVKVDGIGVGWGVAGTLTAWASEGIHDAEIVVVNVAEGTYREDDETKSFRPHGKRDELWLNGRELLQPRTTMDDVVERGLLRLRIDKRTQNQLMAPKYSTNSSGKTVIESKKMMRARGIPSPDRAESLLLAFYEPMLKPESNGVFRVLA